MLSPYCSSVADSPHAQSCKLLPSTVPGFCNAVLIMHLSYACLLHTAHAMLQQMQRTASAPAYLVLLGDLQDRPQNGCGSCLEIQCTSGPEICYTDRKPLQVVISDQCDKDCNATNINVSMVCTCAQQGHTCACRTVAAQLVCSELEGSTCMHAAGPSCRASGHTHTGCCRCAGPITSSGPLPISCLLACLLAVACRCKCSALRSWPP